MSLRRGAGTVAWPEPISLDASALVTLFVPEPGSEALNDALLGADGNDTFVGGPGDDIIYAHLYESRRGKDTVSCGSGNDEVVANQNDVVDPDCEVVHRVPNPRKGKKN